MPTPSPQSLFWRGFRESLPFLIVLVPFAMLFGVVATEAGLSVFETLSFSVVVIAGAAQFTAISLMQDEAPTLIVLATSLAVNLRMGMYSASLTPYLGQAGLWTRAVAAYFIVDQTYAMSIVTFEKEPSWTVSQRVAYFFGVVVPICPMWYVFTLLGAIMGAGLPEWIALDFAVPLAFLALIAPALRTLAHVAAAGTSVVLSLALAGMAYGTGLLVAAIAAMIVGAAVEVRIARRLT